MKYQIKCADPEQHSMFYSDCDPALRNACVGHLRMDFGSDNEFYSSWWENRDDLNDSAFKAELLLFDGRAMREICPAIRRAAHDNSAGS